MIAAIDEAVDLAFRGEIGGMVTNPMLNEPDCAIAIAPLVPAVPATDPASWEGMLILAKEMITGVMMGFAMRLVFAAVEMAGEISSLTMGLGFASFFDPMSQGRSSAISQFLTWIATLMLLVANVHLWLLEALAESFFTLPISGRMFHGGGFWKYHAIHHSSEDVDWISAARFHPVNLLLGTIGVDVALLLAVGGLSGLIRMRTWGLLALSGIVAGVYPAWRGASLPIAATLRRDAV